MMSCSPAESRTWLSTPRPGMARVLVWIVVLFGPSWALAQDGTVPPASGADAVPAIAVPDDGTGVVRIISAERFTVATPYRSPWRADRPEVASGWLLVLEVAADWVKPRQTRQPVLYAGDRPVEVLNVGFPSGTLVVIVPDPLAEEGRPATPVDLARTEFYFGTPMLPERVTAERGREERTEAQAKGITPLAEASRITPSETPLAPGDRAALYRLGGERMLVHVPDERERAEMYIAGSP